ncbi:hypothetical protein Atep_31710 (plasmid) [Allochromatium tepidum]|uniref:Uncharacterized protein n=1 Tax=Allochromatium tepidum TaxID=553982 RepID=A0ABM7QR98_9GAMM|nr:hypothetical protein Atep_31710 [Allochromatium tepidum]
MKTKLIGVDKAFAVGEVALRASWGKRHGRNRSWLETRQS